MKYLKKYNESLIDQMKGVNIDEKISTLIEKLDKLYSKGKSNLDIVKYVYKEYLKEKEDGRARSLGSIYQYYLLSILYLFELKDIKEIILNYWDGEAEGDTVEEYIDSIYDYLFKAFADNEYFDILQNTVNNLDEEKFKEKFYSNLQRLILNYI